MSSVTRNFVEQIGIDDVLPKNPKYFTEISISKNLIIPCKKTNMEQLLSVMVSAEVVSIKLVENPEMISNEGQRLCGCKLIIELKFREKVKYVADGPMQSVYEIHYEDILKSVFVIVPREIGGKLTRDLVRQKKLVVVPYIEDIYSEMKDERTIFQSLTILVDVNGASGLEHTEYENEDSICTFRTINNKSESFQGTIGDIGMIAPSNFKQLYLNEDLKIPSQKPEAEEISNTIVDIEIIREYPIKTIKGKSLEEQILTGNALVVEGVLKQKIEYIAKDEMQSMYICDFNTPFSTFIILPENFREGTDIEVEGIIEDIYTKLVDRRTIFKNVTFRLIAKLRC